MGLQNQESVRGSWVCGARRVIGIWPNLYNYTHLNTQYQVSLFYANSFRLLDVAAAQSPNKLPEFSNGDMDVATAIGSKSTSASCAYFFALFKSIAARYSLANTSQCSPRWGAILSLTIDPPGFLFSLMASWMSFRWTYSSTSSRTALVLFLRLPNASISAPDV
jgi:hypothetical protein